MNIANILKDCSCGTKLYCTLIGNCILSKVTRENTIMVMDSYYRSIELNADGSLLGYEKSECILFPSNDKRDWNEFVKPIPLDVPMMVSVNGNEWSLRYHAVYGATYNDGKNSKTVSRTNNKTSIISRFNYVVPVTEFDFSPEAINNRVNVKKSIV